MIAIVDYGAGNLVSVKKAFDWLGQECEITSDPAVVAKAPKIVLAGSRAFCLDCGDGAIGCPRRDLQRRSSGECRFSGSASGMQWMFEGSRRVSGNARVGYSGGRVRAISRNGEVAARGMELGGDGFAVAAVSRGAVVVVCVFHAFVSGAGCGRDGCLLRIWRAIFGGGGARPSVWSAISSGEIGRDWVEAVEQFLRALTMLTKRIIACLDVDGGRVVKGVQFVELAGRGRSGGVGEARTAIQGRTRSCCWIFRRRMRGERRCWRRCDERRGSCSFPLRWAEGFARLRTRRLFLLLGRTRSASIRLRWPIRD